MPLREDDVTPRTGTSARRTLLQAGGFLLAVLATLAVFLTDNPQVLRLAVVGVAWAFVIATVVAATRSPDGGTAQAREAEVRRAQDGLELEAELRREGQQSMRAELDLLRDELADLAALRRQLAGLADLKDGLARVAELRTDLTALASLRVEVARVADLREDVAALTSLRQELGQVAELRSEMGRLRAELTEQLSSEMLVERIVMRTQGGRLSPERQEVPGRALGSAPVWSEDDAQRELSGGWPAMRLDEPRATREFDQVRDGPVGTRPPVPPPAATWGSSWELDPPRSWEAPATAFQDSLPPPLEETPPTTSWESQPAPGSGPVSSSPADALRRSAAPHPADQHARPSAFEPDPPTTASPLVPRAGSLRGGGASPPPVPTGPPTVVPASEPDPLQLPSGRPAALRAPDAERTAFRPAVPLRRRRDDLLVEQDLPSTAHRPAVSPHPPLRVDERGAYRVAAREEEPAGGPGPAQEKRLADILAENGVSPAAVGRRRRRYRDDDQPDDVLARVLRTD